LLDEPLEVLFIGHGRPPLSGVADSGACGVRKISLMEFSAAAAASSGRGPRARWRHLAGLREGNDRPSRSKATETSDEIAPVHVEGLRE
jgi:hypothetical protein